MKPLLFFLLAIIPFSLIGQPKFSDIPDNLFTNDQKFSTLLHAQFYEVGNIDAIDFRLMVIYDVFNNQLMKKVRIEMIFQNELLVAPKINEFSADEIDGMIRTVDYLIASIKFTDKPSFDEIMYICKGGFTVGAFYTPIKNKWTIYLRLIQDDSKSTLHIDVDELAYFKELLTLMKSKLELISVKDFQS